MADRRLVARPALTGFDRADRVGKASGPAGVAILLRGDLRIASVIARRGAVPELSAQVEKIFALALQSGPYRVARERHTILGIGPGRWMFLQECGAPEFAAELQRDLVGVASVSDHSDGYAVFEVSGICARKTLAKGVAIDLHANSFGTGDVAVTAAAHIGAILWQTNALPCYGLAVFRSYAESFWHWLSESAMEYGIEQTPLRRA
jgi:sarcosine oxidase subunit gamma